VLLLLNGDCLLTVVERMGGRGFGGVWVIGVLGLLWVFMLGVIHFILK